MTFDQFFSIILTMTDQTLHTCYYTGEIKDHDCASAGRVVQLAVASNSRSEWVCCPFCVESIAVVGGKLIRKRFLKLTRNGLNCSV